MPSPSASTRRVYTSPSAAAQLFAFRDLLNEVIDGQKRYSAGQLLEAIILRYGQRVVVEELNDLAADNPVLGKVIRGRLKRMSEGQRNGGSG